jgi:hypothetical protein
MFSVMGKIAKAARCSGYALSSTSFESVERPSVQSRLASAVGTRERHTFADERLIMLFTFCWSNSA